MAIKKQKSPEKSPSTTVAAAVAVARKRNITSTESVEERIRRTRSEEVSNPSGGIMKQVFRNKVRRYKLLDEVSS